MKFHNRSNRKLIIGPLYRTEESFTMIVAKPGQIYDASEFTIKDDSPVMIFVGEEEEDNEANKTS